MGQRPGEFVRSVGTIGFLPLSSDGLASFFDLAPPQVHHIGRHLTLTPRSCLGSSVFVSSVFVGDLSVLVWDALLQSHCGKTCAREDTPLLGVCVLSDTAS